MTITSIDTSGFQIKLGETLKIKGFPINFGMIIKTKNYFISNHPPKIGVSTTFPSDDMVFSNV